MKSIISLVMALILVSSPFADLGLIIHATSINDGQSNVTLEESATSSNSEAILGDEISKDDNTVEESTDSNESEDSVNDEQQSDSLVSEEIDVSDEIESSEESSKVEEVQDKELAILEDKEVIESVDQESEETVAEQLTVVESPKEVKAATGSLELDLYFPLPLENVNDFIVTLKQGDNLIGSFDLSALTETGTSGEYPYTFQTLDSKRVPLSEKGSIYFVYLKVDQLPVGTYELEVSGAGYETVKLSNIELNQYSKRVKFASSSSNLAEYPAALLSGDVNGNGSINDADYQATLNQMGTYQVEFDFNRDERLDITDLSYVYSNKNQTQQQANIEDTTIILDVTKVEMASNDLVLPEGQQLADLLTDESTVSLSRPDATAPSEESPLTIAMNFPEDAAAVLMEQIVIKVPSGQTLSDEAGTPEKGYIVYTDDEGVEHQVPFDNSLARSNGDIVIDLGAQVAVKKITINVTGNRGNKTISEIAKVEFLNNVYTELPAPDMNIPVIKTLETSTNLHDERITISWDPEPNVTSYEVTYERLDEATGKVLSTKKLQTSETQLNILDKAITPYSVYRVSVQSLNGDWNSGYKLATITTTTTSSNQTVVKADNVDVDYNPIDSYYNGLKGSSTVVQVIPNTSPAQPINLTTAPGFKSFTVSWEKHIQARDFDIYYRKVGATKWIKANENKIEVDLTDDAVTNPNKQYLHRGGSYMVNGLDDNATYEVRVSATNHLGTSKLSDVYLASTENVTPPVMNEYDLINRPNPESLVGTDHIINVINKNDPKDEGGWGNDGALTYDSKYALVDGEFGTSWKVRDWDTGAVYGSNRGSIIEFDDVYQIGSISFAQSLEQGYKHSVKDIKITYWTADNTQVVKRLQHPENKPSNGHNVYTIYLDEPIEAKKIKVDIAGYGGSVQSMSELRFYTYNSLETDVKALFKDSLRIQLADNVTQEMIDSLVTRANTADEVSGEYHPKQAIILKELQLAQDLLNDQQLSETIIELDPTIRDNGAAIGMGNAWQSLGAVARPSTDDNDQAKSIVVYMGSTDANTQVEITFLQAYGAPGQYISKSTIIKPGRTEIAIPQIFTADVEKGGVVMAKVRSGSTSATIQLRLSNVDAEIPHLNVNNLINDETKVEEVKALINDYIVELETYVQALPSMYPTKVSDTDKLNNVYLYSEQTSVLNSTDIEGDRFTLTVPATQVYKGITSGLSTREQQVERVYNALKAWEQEMLVVYAKKGVFESVQDFDGNGTIDQTDQNYFNKHKAPTTRLNVKYQRMVMGAAAYASSHHVGVGFGEAVGFMQGVPYLFDEAGNVTNANEAKLYGALMGHEIGHVVDIGNRTYPETSNNLLAEITDTMMNEDAPKVSGALSELYKKVTSNTYGLSTNRSVVLGMLWQPHLAYEDNSTYEMLLTNFDGNLEDDSYFAKLNRAYREMTAEEKANGDRDQWLIRLSSKVVGKDLTAFYEAHGIIANETTLAYVSQFEEETRPIQYMNDEARRRRLEGTATMPKSTQLVATFGDGITDRSYINDKTVPFELSVTSGNEYILGYEIIRNGQPSGFILRDETNEITTYEDVISGGNNRTYTYEVVAYDYNLNATNKVSLGTVKVRHDGGIASQLLNITSSTVDTIEENNDFHAAVPNTGLANMLDGDLSTVYVGRKLTNNEYNTMDPHNDQLKPNVTSYIQLDLQSIKSVIGLKYTAPVTEGWFKTSIGEHAIKKYIIDVSVDGTNWTRINEGTFKLDPENPTEMVYFAKPGVTSGTQLNTYQIRYVRLYAPGANTISVAELELVGPPGDNIEIGVSTDGMNYENGIGVLSHDYIYQADNADTEEDETMMIPQGSIIITGEYSGNPAFNIPLVLNQDELHIADEYSGILLAEIPSDGNLEEISKGTWIYWVEPAFVDQFKENQQIFAELYRTDSANLSEGGQRLVSNTFTIEVPEVLPSISLSKLKSSHQVVTTITTEDIANLVQQ